MQKKYLVQFQDLYEEDFHLVKVPLFDREIRGINDLNVYGNFLFQSPTPEQLVAIAEGKLFVDTPK